MDKNQRKTPVIFADYRNTITGDVNMNINNNTIFKVAIYLRLSKEDGNFSLNGKFESNSINSQREIIMNYLKKHPEMEIYDEYKDDGKTGTNFERNEFQRMYDDVKSGKVNCIIVKDLSRFGRDYIDCGRYIEKEFPSMNVRFIAINDTLCAPQSGDILEGCLPHNFSV